MRWIITGLISATICLVTQQGHADSPNGKPHGKDISSSLHSHPDAPTVALPERYLQAVKNVQDANETNVSKELTPILQSNSNLIWRGTGSNRQVLVVTWSTRESYWKSQKQPIGKPFQEQYTVWVTAAPELKEFCQRYGDHNDDVSLSRRLEQLLGLPPNSGHQYVVEMWVKPEDLFRPSADPEITDFEAQLKFPDVREYVSVSKSYKQWYRSTATARYKPPNGPPYPWTRLGYTYDWGNNKTRVGLSEFVIRAGAELTVHSITLTDNYADSASP